MFRYPGDDFLKHPLQEFLFQVFFVAQRKIQIF
jgi:hypothetical protein